MEKLLFDALSALIHVTYDFVKLPKLLLNEHFVRLTDNKQEWIKN